MVWRILPESGAEYQRDCLKHGPVGDTSAQKSTANPPVPYPQVIDGEADFLVESTPAAMTMKGRLIFNPAAGSQATDDSMREAAEIFRESGWEMGIAVSQSGEDTGALAREAAANELDAVIVAGGDGSVGKAAAALAGTRTALGVLPTGTANVWATEIGTPGNSLWRRNAIQASARALCSGMMQAVDIGKCESRAFLLWAGAGLDAEIVKVMESGRKGRRSFARTKYVAAGLKKASTWKGIDIDLRVDGRAYNGHYLLAVISNIRSYAGGLSAISPQAVLDDGIMELWLFSGDSMKLALRHAWDLLAGRHIRSKEVKFIQFRQLEMQAGHDIDWQMDGEPIRTNGEVVVEVSPRALQVITPIGRPPGLFSLAGEALDARQTAHV